MDGFTLGVAVGVVESIVVAVVGFAFPDRGPITTVRRWWRRRRWCPLCRGNGAIAGLGFSYSDHGLRTVWASCPRCEGTGRR